MLILTYLAQVCVVDELLHDLHLAADHKLYLLSQKPLLDRLILGATFGSLIGTITLYVSLCLV